MALGSHYSVVSPSNTPASPRHGPATFTSVHLGTLRAVAAYLPGSENPMDDRILSGALFVALSAAFGSHGIGALLTAYRTGDYRIAAGFPCCNV